VLGAALKRLSKRDKVLKLAMIERLYPFGAFKPNKWHADQYWPHIVSFFAILMVLSDFPDSNKQIFATVPV
jgi:hypothetical protein